MTRGDADQIALVVHEVRSPVAALAALAETVSETAGSARAEVVRLALGACVSIERIVTDLALASLRLEPVDLGALVVDAVATYGRGVTLRVEPGLPDVDADPVRLRQAVDNLVANAHVHGQTEDPVRIHVGAAPGGVAVTVSDSGPGVPARDLERIFEPGIRLDDRRPGSGLGLAVTRTIATAHGGTVGAESDAGGATFTLWLPVHRDHPATRGSRE